MQPECRNTMHDQSVSRSDAILEQSNWGALSELPGHPMMWVLLLSEFAVFGILFVAFSVARLLHPAVFVAGQAHLDVTLAGINTLVLVTSGWFAARAVAARVLDKRAIARRFLIGAMILGTLFIAIKFIEYGVKLEEGIGLGNADTFFTLYFLLTGFHLMHVALGIVILGIVGWHDTPDNLRTGTAFWHIVDLLWIVMYPIVYLVR